jgi:prevent-host-death family protein
MTIHVNIGEAKTRLSKLIAAAKRGEEVFIDRNGRPDVRLVPVDPDQHLKERAEKRRRFFGAWKGKIDDSGIDWFAPMSDEELAQWYDAPLYHPPEDDESSS